MLFAEKYRAQILNGALVDHKTCLAGFCRGYYITLTVNKAYNICVNASREEDTDNVALGAFLGQLRAGNNKILGITVLPNRFTVSIRAANIGKKVPEQINSIMEPILNHLTLNGYTSGCGSCGSNAAQLSSWQVNNEVCYLCDACAGKLEESLQENQTQTREQKSNLIPGLVGAFLGTLIGVALWILLSRLGIIAGVAGLVMGVCAMKGYELMGKQLDRKGVISCIVLLIVMIYFSNKLAWSIDGYLALKEYDWTFGEVFQNLSIILAESDLTGSYFRDLGLGFLLTAAASFSSIINAFRASNGSYRIRKIK